MSHNCFISFKKEDSLYVDRILNRLGKERILGKALDEWIDSENIDYIMQKIRKDYMEGTTVTIFVIGEHSSENEGSDYKGDKNAFIKRELQATLYDADGFPRSGLLGIVLPKMEQKIFGGRYRCSTCGEIHSIVNISDETVIKEFSTNYYLVKDAACSYSEDGRFCVLVKYSDFMNEPDKYIDLAFNKLLEPINKKVHWRDLR